MYNGKLDKQHKDDGLTLMNISRLNRIKECSSKESLQDPKRKMHKRLEVKKVFPEDNDVHCQELVLNINIRLRSTLCLLPIM